MNRMQKNSDRWGWAYLDMLLDRFQKLPYSRVPSAPVVTKGPSMD